MSLTLKTKLTLAFFVAITLSISSMSATVFLGINKYSKSSFANNSSAQLLLIDEYIEQLVTEGMNSIKYLASLESSRRSLGQMTKFLGPDAPKAIDPKIMSPLELELFNSFNLMVKSHPAYEAVFIGSVEGEYMQYPAIPRKSGYDPRERSWYKKAYTSFKDAELSKAYVTTGGSTVASMMTKVKNYSGKTVGVLGLDINLETLTGLTAKLNLGRTGHIMLLEGDGTILANTRHKDLILQKAQDSKEPALQELARTSTGTFESQIGNENKLVTVKISDSTGWKLAYIIDSSEVLEPARNMLATILLIGFGLGAVLLIGAWMLARTLVRPLNLLSSSAAAVAGGDFNALPEAKHFSGEFLTLYTSFKEMLGKLVNIINTAEEKTRDAEEQSQQAQEALQEAELARTQAEQAQDEMSQVARALEGIVEQMTSASQQLSSQIREASQGATTQRDRTAETATAMEEMNASVLEVARNASHAAESADNAQQEAKNGEQIVDNVVKSIGQVNTNAEIMSNRLNSLGKQAQDIGQIMTVITDIADQTNLLALNAAIEAARAGEAGRGFAVVADEVRKLAESTMSATREVGESVTAIQQGTNQAITEMNETNQLVNTSTEFAQKAGQALHGILGIVESTADQVRAIAAASEEQSATSEEINRNTEEVNQIANQTTLSMEQSTQAVNDLSRLAEEMVSLIGQLKRKN